jgi:hypothetical protein
MQQPHGYVVWTEPDKPVAELDTIRCGHCGCAIFVKPGTGGTVYLRWSVRAQRWKEDMGCGCLLCYERVCLACHADGRCLPLERRLEQMER